MTAAVFSALALLLPTNTPGATNPAVTQATIQTTVCVRGWTRTIRPSRSFTSALKRRQIKAWGLPGSTRDYEEDHLLPLELGGAPRDPANLWPEPWAQADRSDPIENELHKAVCDGDIRLVDAQDLIVAFKRVYG